jgi:hypothetical protein
VFEATYPQCSAGRGRCVEVGRSKSGVETTSLGVPQASSQGHPFHSDREGDSRHTLAGSSFSY